MARGSAAGPVERTHEQVRVVPGLAVSAWDLLVSVPNVRARVMGALIKEGALVKLGSNSDGATMELGTADYGDCSGFSSSGEL